MIESVHTLYFLQFGKLLNLHCFFFPVPNAMFHLPCFVCPFSQILFCMPFFADSVSYVLFTVLYALYCTTTVVLKYFFSLGLLRMSVSLSYVLLRMSCLRF